MQAKGEHTMPALAILAVAAMTLTGCARTVAGESRQIPPARMERVGNSLSVVLTPLGAQRIGIQTEPCRTHKKVIVIPFDALLYEPDGQTAVYLQTARLTFTRAFVTVARIVGNDVFVTQGLTAGAQVVTVGAEELLGVQNGVGVET
jgi:hypothetical protein